MTNKRWIYVGMLVVSGIGFAVDRLFLSEPKAADAEEVTPPPKPKPASAGKKQEKATAIHDPSLSWLEKLADSGPGRDVFAPSPAWLEAREETVEKARQESAQKNPQPDSSELFRAAHHLQATTVVGRSGLAVVDGQCLKVGDTLDEFRLTRVTAGEVEFDRGAERVILSLPMGPASATERAATPLRPKNAVKNTPATRPAGSKSILRLLLDGNPRK